MKIALLGDIHANWDAFQAVLADCESQGVSDYVCLGDVVGYNAAPVECLEKIQELKCPTVRGNHDHYCAFDIDLSGFHPMAADVVDWTRRQLSEQQRLWLRELPFSRMVETFTIVHSTLDTPENWGYVFDKYDAEMSMNYQTTSVCFYGHTHVPMAFEKGMSVRGGAYEKVKIRMGHKYFINVGSIGQPRDGNPDAAYVIFHLFDNLVELRRVKYDVGAAQQRILDAGLPRRAADRLGVGR